VLGNINGVGRTPAFKALVIPKNDQYSEAYRDNFKAAIKSGEINIVDGNSFIHKGVMFVKKSGIDYDYSDPKAVVEPKVFGNIDEQNIYWAVKPDKTIRGRIFSVINANKDEAESSLARLLTRNNHANCMPIDDKYIVDREY